jgi:hypothetical protein
MILERSWCLCKDSLCQKRNGINEAVCILCGVRRAVAARFHDVNLA